MTIFKDKNPKILLVGDLMIDHYLWGNCERISPEAPVAIVDIEKESSVLGGAGNVAHNLYALGAEVDILSVIGDDENANNLKDMLEEININSDYLIVEKNRKSSKKNRIIVSSQQIIRYDKESTKSISHNIEMEIINLFKSKIEFYDIVILSDYGKGLLTENLTQHLISIGNRANIKVLVDPKGFEYFKYKNAYLLTPNKKEAINATNIKIEDEVSLERAIKKLKEDLNLNISLVTLSEDGIAIYDNNLRVKPTVAKEVYDVTGAGDTVIASIAFALACGYDIDKAVEFSNLSAGVVVGKIGSATATLDEIIAYESSIHKSNSHFHIKTIEEITRLTIELKNRGRRIVFTNGCFDILHIGHVKYLEEAKSYGDILIVGLNSDNSVRRLKGDSRPINSEDDRAYILASLEAVDYVVKFTDDTPYELIKSIVPHILVKGGDYEGKDVVGQDIADELRLVTFIDGKSTTKTIEKIKNK